MAHFRIFGRMKLSLFSFVFSIYIFCDVVVGRKYPVLESSFSGETSNIINPSMSVAMENMSWTRSLKSGTISRQGGAITLDPVSIISLLALGAFLINNILQLLRTNSLMTHSGRSLDVNDLNLPMDLSDIQVAVQGFEDSRVMEDGGETRKPMFGKLFANIGSLYYLSPRRRNACMKKVVCNYKNAPLPTRNAVQSFNFKSKIFEFLLYTITRIVAPEIADDSKTPCEKVDRLCSDTTLHNAKIEAENKVYNQVYSFVSNYAIQELISG